MEEEGRRLRQRLLGRGQTGLGDEDGNPIGVRDQQPGFASARDPGFRGSLAGAVGGS